MNILAGQPNDCVAVAVSTMRLALGYKTPWAKGVPFIGENGMCTRDMAKYTAKMFRRHDVLVWCDEETRQYANLGKSYMCTSFSNLKKDKDKIVMFVYYSDDDPSKTGHAVIGYPSLTGNMRCSIVIAVQEKKKSH